MEDMMLEKSDELVMKLLHFFITENGYSPIVLHGAKNEIWLENLQNDYQVVRIVSNYIHNNEQLNFDIYRTHEILKRIKKKTLSLKMETLSIFLNIGESVKVDDSTHINNIDCAYIKKINDLKNYQFVIDSFPSITKKTSFKEKGAELFMKITKDIAEKNETENRKAEDVFARKKPIVTVALIAINILVFLSMYIFGDGSNDVYTLIKFGANYAPLVKLGEYYRLITSAFIHIGFLHLIMNLYALYIVGSQIESFLGKGKYIVIYLGSAVLGSLMSIIFSDSVSAGASGAIFGLFGSLLYFGYHYRVYLGSVIKSQIIPLILLNLMLGFMSAGIDNSAHIGGLIGGALITMTVGVKYKSSSSEKVNGFILTAMYSAFLIVMAFFMK